MINTRHIKRSKCIRVKHYDYTVDCETTRPLPPPPPSITVPFHYKWSVSTRATLNMSHTKKS